jgi:hypothetical protein
MQYYSLRMTFPFSGSPESNTRRTVDLQPLRPITQATHTKPWGANVDILNGEQSRKCVIRASSDEQPALPYRPVRRIVPPVPPDWQAG